MLNGNFVGGENGKSPFKRGSLKGKKHDDGNSLERNQFEETQQQTFEYEHELLMLVNGDFEPCQLQF